MSKIVIGLTGPMAAGKGTVADYLKTNHHAAVYKFSTALRDVLDRIYVEQSRANMQNISSILRQGFGDDLLASIIAQDVKNDQDHELIVIDGVRRLPDIKYLRQLPEFKLIAVSTEQQTRWQRMTLRGENPDDITKTFDQFKLDEQAEAEKDIVTVAGTADLTVDNNGSIEDLHHRINQILTDWQ